MAAAAGVLLLAAGTAVGAAWAKIPLLVLGGLTALVGAGSLIVAVWGRYVGMAWHFTPAPAEPAS